MARPGASLSFLNELLEGTHPTSADLDKLILEVKDEDQWLDYKSGLLLSKQSAAEEVRQYVTGFANAEGGVLLIGVSEPPKPAPRQVDGATAPGGAGLISWATSVLNPLRPRLAPSPRVGVIAHSKGDVLFIAVARTSALVPVVEKSLTVYYLRLGDSTARVPDYLAADLLLGRRSGARLGISSVTARYHDMPADGQAKFMLRIEVENEALVTAPTVLVVVVCADPHQAMSPLVHALKQEVVLTPSAATAGRVMWTYHALLPFESVGGELPIIIDARTRSRQTMGIMVQADSGRPRWYQVVAEFDGMAATVVQLDEVDRPSIAAS